MKKMIAIEGMGCEHCVRAVRDALDGLEGVTVDHVEIGGARVDVDTGLASDDRIDAAIRQAGYEPTSHTAA